jgi:hypothetical protein
MRACGSGRRLMWQPGWGPGATVTGWPPPATRDPAFRVGAGGARVDGGSAVASWWGVQGEGFAKGGGSAAASWRGVLSGVDLKPPLPRRRGLQRRTGLGMEIARRAVGAVAVSTGARSQRGSGDAWVGAWWGEARTFH